MKRKDAEGALRSSGMVMETSRVAGAAANAAPNGHPLHEG